MLFAGPEGDADGAAGPNARVGFKILIASIATATPGPLSVAPRCRFATNPGCAAQHHDLVLQIVAGISAIVLFDASVASGNRASRVDGHLEVFPLLDHPDEDGM